MTTCLSIDEIAADRGLLDREKIRDCLYRYSQGADRCDTEMMKSAYWPDATDTHGAFDGNAMDFVDRTIPFIRSMEQVSHLLGNILIRIEGTTAKVESYLHAFHSLKGEAGEPYDIVLGARFLDRMEKRDDEWRISKRIVVCDWVREYPDAGDLKKGMFGQQVPIGGRVPEDHVYTWLGMEPGAGGKTGGGAAPEL